MLSADTYLINPSELVGNYPSRVCCEETGVSGVSGKEPSGSSECYDISGKAACLSTPGCWWDNSEKNLRCQPCPDKCEGYDPFFGNFLGLGFNIGQKDIFFYSQEDCEKDKCGLDLCVWDENSKKCKTATNAASKLAKLIGNFDKKLSESFEGSPGQVAPINSYVNSPEAVSDENLEEFWNRLEELREDLDFMIEFLNSDWFATHRNSKIENWDNKINAAMNMVRTKTSNVILVSIASTPGYYDNSNKIITFNNNAEVCAISVQGGKYYNNNLKGETILINGQQKTIENEDVSANVNWYKIEPYLEHEEAGFRAPFPTVLEDENYKWYQNIVTTPFFSQGKDVIQYKQTSAGTGWCINVDSDYGVHRYRAEVNDVSSLGNSVQSKGMSAEEAGYPSIYNTLESTLLEPEAYDFSGGGISNNVHRIVRKSNYAQQNSGMASQNELLFIEYVEAHTGIVWIYGAEFWQAENFIGMDCADIVAGAINMMVDAGYLSSSVRFSELPSAEQLATDPGRQVSTYTKTYKITRAVVGGQEQYTITDPDYNTPVEIYITAGAMHPGDLLLLKHGTASGNKAFHTLILYEDKQNKNGQVGTLDENDIFIYVSHEGIITLDYFKHITEKYNKNEIYFRIARVKELNS
jgi:hypothetical protein